MSLIYILRLFVRRKFDTIVKVLSLAFGFFIGIVLLTQVSFILSYDNFYPEVENIYRIERKINFLDKSSISEGPVIHAPIPAAMKSDIRGIHSSTIISPPKNIRFTLNDNSITGKVVTADEGFWDVFGTNLVIGDLANLALSSQIFLSESFAESLFGAQDPMGKIVLYDNRLTVKVAGIFKDLPKNTHLKYDAILSFQTLLSELGYHPSWDENDSYWGYVKLENDVQAEDIEREIPNILPKYYDVQAKSSEGKNFSYYLKPIKEIYSSTPEVKHQLIILSILAILLLCIASSNYVLITISSLPQRARAIAVFKCNGANAFNIFRFLVLENVLFLLSGLLIGLFAILMCENFINNLLPNVMGNIFMFRNFFVISGIFFVLMLISGIIPAYYLSKISVLQLFAGSYVDIRWWKNILLFMQTVLSVGVVCFLMIISRQYKTIISKDLGYDIENVFYAQLKVSSQSRFETLKSELASIPSVESVAIGTDIPLISMNGDYVINSLSGEKLFLCRLMGVDIDYFRVLNIPLKDGSLSALTTGETSRVCVNLEFVQRLNQLGYSVLTDLRNVDGEKTITGIVNNFQLGDANHELEPIMVYLIEPSKGVWWAGRYFLLVKVKESSPEVYTILSKKLKSLMPDEEVEFKSYKNEWLSIYSDVQKFKDIVLVSAILIFIITLFGLTCYLKDEIERKRKRIAISRIHGAQAYDIFVLLMHDCLFPILLGFLIGVLGAYWVSANWLEQFAYKMPLNIYILILSGIPILLIMIFCIYICLLRIIRDNPIKYIRME